MADKRKRMTVAEETDLRASVALLVDEERLRALLVEWAEKAFPEAEDEEGGVSELVADAIASLRPSAEVPS